jgi:hypothetical protein
MKRPVVFVSSTVHDLGDMRSALKYWLEEWGYEVRLSEFADFPGVLETNSYDACTKAVDGSDFCVVLIGTRGGGLWDAATGVTISRREYQVAYGRAQLGAMRVLVFVRDSVWTLFQDQHKEPELHDSPVMSEDDKKVVFAFIEEARRAEDMRAAAAGGGARPINNWIFPFKTFEDIVTAIRTQLLISGPLPKATMKANLLSELEGNLSRLAVRSKNAWVFADDLGRPLERLRLGADRLNDQVALGDPEAKGVFLYLGLSFTGWALSTLCLDAAVTSGEFLQYDLHSATPVVGRAQTELLRLREKVARLADPKWARTASAFLQAYGDVYRQGMRSFPAFRLAGLAGAWREHRTARARMVAVARYLLTDNEGELEAVEEGPLSPLSGEAELVAQEKVSPDEIRAWLLEGKPDVG